MFNDSVEIEVQAAKSPTKGKKKSRPKPGTRPGHMIRTPQQRKKASAGRLKTAKGKAISKKLKGKKKSPAHRTNIAKGLRAYWKAYKSGKIKHKRKPPFGRKGGKKKVGNKSKKTKKPRKKKTNNPVGYH